MQVEAKSDGGDCPEDNAEHGSGSEPVPVLFFNVGSEIINDSESEYDEDDGEHPLKEFGEDECGGAESDVLAEGGDDVSAGENQEQGGDQQSRHREGERK